MDGEYTIRYNLKALRNMESSADAAGRVLAISVFPAPVRKAPVVLKLGTVDILAQCPKCKTVETVQVIGDMLTRCRKFSQREGRVYHDCGSEEPCRLLRVSPESRTSAR